MAGPTNDGAAELLVTHTDGSLLSRIEMEQRLRNLPGIKTVQHKRLLAISSYGLESKVAYDMKPITLIHWILDKMIEKREASGEKMGVSHDLGADHVPDNFKQFCQRLAVFIENGWATMPMNGEVSMSDLPQGLPAWPGQSVPSDGQSAQPFTPGPVAPMPQAPQMQMPPQQQFAPQQQYAAPPPPPMPMQASIPAPGQPAPMMMAPPPQPQGPILVYPNQQPQQQQFAPPAPPAPPQQPQQQFAPPQQQASASVLIKEDPQREWLKPSPNRTTAGGGPTNRRNKAERMEDDAWIAAGKPSPVQTMTSAQAQQSGFQVSPSTMTVGGASPAPQAPQQQAAPPQMAFAPPPSMGPPAAPMAPPPPPTPQQYSQGQASSPSDPTLGILLQNQEKLAKKLEGLSRSISVIDMALAWKLRKETGTGGDCTCEAFLRDLASGPSR